MANRPWLRINLLPTPSGGAGLQETTVGARMHVISSASHMAPLEKPDVINGHLKEFPHGPYAAARGRPWSRPVLAAVGRVYQNQRWIAVTMLV